MNEVQKMLLTEQQKFIKHYKEIFGNVMYRGFSHLFKLELDVEWFTEKLKTIKEISERIDEISNDKIDHYVIKRKDGNIDMYVINVYINGLYESILSVVKTIKETPF